MSSNNAHYVGASSGEGELLESRGLNWRGVERKHVGKTSDDE